MNSAILLSFLRRLLILLPTLTIMGCGGNTPTGPPGATYPVRYEALEVIDVTPIKAVVRHGEEWIEINSPEITDRLRSLIPRGDIEPYAYSWLDMRLLSGSLWRNLQFDDMSLSYRWENNTFRFMNSDTNFPTIHGYGTSEEFMIPIVECYDDSKAWQGYHEAFYERGKAPYEQFKLHDFRTDGSDTLYYRTFEIVMRPLP